jgi:hypothetical protein
MIEGERTEEFGMRNAECGKKECGVRNLRVVGRGYRSEVGGRRTEECGMRNAECGKKECGIKQKEAEG